MYRTHNCGELRQSDVNKQVTLSGWVQKARNMGGMTFVDVRDRYGVSQFVFNMETNPSLCEQARKLGREFVIKIEGTVTERSNKNKNIETGDIEIIANSLEILSKSEVPPFLIEDVTDGGEELRLKYRYLDLRRKPVQNGLFLRHKMAKEIRNFLDSQDFIEVETPVLIKSSPEGARDFVVPSRMNPGFFYALPQSPQLFKQLLMVAGFDRYYQIVKCFRDEDFRSDRQPEFTQIDCELSFIEQEDILRIFEGMAKHLFKTIMNYDFPEAFPRMTYAYAMENYGNDRPDIRFGMKIHNLTNIVKGKNFQIFDDAEYIGGICAEGCSEYTRKQLDALTDFVKRPQIGAKGMIYLKYGLDGTLKSSVDKFYNTEELNIWASQFNAKPGDLILVLSGAKSLTLKGLSELRHEMGNQLGLRNDSVYAPLWVIDFPLLEFDEELGRYHAMHHPFTSPKTEDIGLMDTNPAEVRANAYDLVVNGSEIGGGSIRIHNTEMQEKMFELLGFTKEDAEAQFGYLMKAFKYGAPPHGGLAFGFDRWAALFNHSDSIRDVIAFPKNNAGKDIMIDSPSTISQEQLDELFLQIKKR